MPLCSPRLLQRITRLAALASLGWSPMNARAEAPATEAANASAENAQPAWDLLEPLIVEKLDNGMTFLIYPTRRAPIFTGLIRFDVGGKDELPGQTGIAHMFEHMAFKGTTNFGSRDPEGEKAALAEVERTAEIFDAARERAIDAGLSGAELEAKIAEERKAFEAAKAAAAAFVVKDEFDAIYNREGGSQMNATTSSDATTYFISLPANRLELWMKMESDRLINPVLREFYSERDVVMEERRMRLDNSPTGQLWELTNATAYVASPYGYPVIGWEADIRNLKASEALKFRAAHYTPEKGLGVIVGDVDVEETRALLRKYFGPLPKRAADAPMLRIQPEPTQQGERRAVLAIQATPELMMGWHKPQLPNIADVRAEMLAEVLTGGRSALWFEKFVKEKRIATEVQCFIGPGDALPNMFMVYASPQGETTLETLEGAIRAEVTRLKSELIDEDALDRARKRRRAAVINTLKTNLGLAQALGSAAQDSGDPYYLERRLRELETVTAQDLQDFVKTYMADTNLTVGTIVPPGDEAAAAAAGEAK